MQELYPTNPKKRGSKEQKRNKINIAQSTYMRLQEYKVSIYKRDFKILQTPNDIIVYLLDNATK